MNKLFITLFAVLLCIPFALRAETTAGDSLVPDLAQDETMKSAGAASTAFVPAFGGWFTQMFAGESKSAYSFSTSSSSLRLWGRLGLGGNSFVYARVRDTYTAVLSKNKIPEKQITGESANDFDLDVAFIELANERRTLQLDLGRRFFSVGSGLVVNGRGDGAEASLRSSIVDVSVFGFYTGLMDKDSNPYGLSDRDFSDGAKRVFAGGSAEKSWENQTGYIFAVVQKDYAKESLSSKRYDSQYWGLGVKGALRCGIDYSAEGVYETGTSSANKNPSEKSGISAYAFTGGLSWSPDIARRPTFVLQYAFASGDADREAPTTASGNQYGGDGGFVPFGTFTSGYAFRPALSNLHLVRLGPTIKPFSAEMSFGARYDLYYKASDGAVSNYGDNAENGKSRFAGQGIDVIYRWAPYRDLSVFINYGLFVPGRALKESEMVRHFAAAGANIVF